MPIHPSRIGFDIDGVVANTMEAFIRLARTEYGAKVRPEEITEFQVENCLNLDPVMVAEIFRRLLEEPLACGLRLMSHARQVLTGFAEHGPLTFITARPQKKPIARWLKKELGPQVYGRVRLVATGEHDNKKWAWTCLWMTGFRPVCSSPGKRAFSPLSTGNPGTRAGMLCPRWRAGAPLTPCVMGRRSGRVPGETMLRLRSGDSRP